MPRLLRRNRRSDGPGGLPRRRLSYANVAASQAHVSGVSIGALDPNTSGGSTGTDVYGTLISLTGSSGFGYGTWAVTG